jgi:hypothetical protein
MIGMQEISDILLKQRIRNRIIEVIEIIASYEAWEEFGGDEVINMWDDWVDDNRIGHYIEPVFTKQEQECMAELQNRVNQVVDHAPQFLPSISELKGNAYWSSLVLSASKALAIFNQRGRMSEEIEITEQSP